MAKHVDEFDYELVNSVIRVSGDNGMIEEATRLHFVTVPTNLMADSSTVKATFFQQITSMQKNVTSQQENEIRKAREKEESDIMDIDSYLMVLHNNPDANFVKLWDSFKRILLSTCRINGTIKLTEHTYTQISSYDLERMLGAYMKNFFGASPQMKKKETA